MKLNFEKYKDSVVSISLDDYILSVIATIVAIVIYVTAINASKDIIDKFEDAKDNILNDKTSIISPDSVFLNGNVLSVSTKLGCFDIEINCESEYITFELISSLPKDAWKCCIANVKYSYDYVDKLKRWEIGNLLNYSEDMISKIKEKALNKISKKPRSH